MPWETGGSSSGSLKILSKRFYPPLLAFLLAACVVRFWIFLLRESFWLDETVTAFIIRHGAGHPSLAAGPRLDQTIYYWLPRAAKAIFGFSELSLRLPSLVATLFSLFLISRLAARFVHPMAGWFAVFVCFIPREFTRQATDARPYGLGTLAALAAVWFLVRWLDEGKWRDAALFAVFAALLVRVHLIYWPFYAVLAGYALLRLVRRETVVSARWLAAVFAAIAASLAPLIVPTLGLLREAKSHVVVQPPALGDILGGFQIALVAAAGIGLWLVARILRWTPERGSATLSGTALLVGWWLWQPACLLAVSAITGNSVFVPRYFSLALPGLALVCTLAAGYSVPGRAWKPAAATLATGILIVGVWKEPFPPSRNSHWREAAAEVNDLAASGTPAICPSPFVEGVSPAWSPAYPLPGFLYAHLDAYPLRTIPILFPARREPEGDRYARSLIANGLLRNRRFAIYGGWYGVSLWTDWFAAQPELRGWQNEQVGRFGDAEIVLFFTRSQ